MAQPGEFLFNSPENGLAAETFRRQQAAQAMFDRNEARGGFHATGVSINPGYWGSALGQREIVSQQGMAQPPMGRITDTPQMGGAFGGGGYGAHLQRADPMAMQPGQQQLLPRTGHQMLGQLLGAEQEQFARPRPFDFRNTFLGALLGSSFPVF